MARGFNGAVRGCLALKVTLGDKRDPWELGEVGGGSLTSKGVEQAEAGSLSPWCLF